MDSHDLTEWVLSTCPECGCMFDADPDDQAECPECEHSFDPLDDKGGPMGWFTPDDKLSPIARQILTALAECGESEAAAVAEALNTIASNDEESATDDFLVGCAQQLIEAAQHFINKVKGEPVVPAGEPSPLRLQGTQALNALHPVDAPTHVDYSLNEYSTKLVEIAFEQARILEVQRAISGAPTFPIISFLRNGQPIDFGRYTADIEADIPSGRYRLRFQIYAIHAYFITDWYPAPEHLLTATA